MKYEWNRCPKCEGELFLNQDLFGEFEQCLQCGYNHDIIVMPDHQKTRKRLGEIGFPFDVLIGCPGRNT